MAPQERLVVASPAHEVTYQELVALVNRHARELAPLEILAVAANMLGKLAALQDQRTTSSRLAMEVIAKNIELGNAQALAEVAGKPAGHG